MLKRDESVEAQKAESADRRHFLRNAMRIGGAAALLLTSASREILAQSLALSQTEMDAARRAQEAPGAASQGGHADGGRAESYKMYGGCENSCQGGCQGCTASCAHSCSGDCLGGCQGDCKGACQGGCKGGCEGTCQGTGESASAWER
jgi:modification target Cys-rich repeat protein